MLFFFPRRIGVKLVGNREEPSLSKRRLIDNGTAFPPSRLLPPPLPLPPPPLLRCCPPSRLSLPALVVTIIIHLISRPICIIFEFKYAKLVLLTSFRAPRLPALCPAVVRTSEKPTCLSHPRCSSARGDRGNYDATRSRYRNIATRNIASPFLRVPANRSPLRSHLPVRRMRAQRMTEKCFVKRRD